MISWSKNTALCTIELGFAGFLIPYISSKKLFPPLLDFFGIITRKGGF